MYGLIACKAALSLSHKREWRGANPLCQGAHQHASGSSKSGSGSCCRSRCLEVAQGRTQSSLCRRGSCHYMQRERKATRWLGCWSRCPPARCTGRDAKRRIPQRAMPIHGQGVITHSRTHTMGDGLIKLNWPLRKPSFSALTQSNP